MTLEPLAPPQAKALIREILEKGIVTYARPHALQRLSERHLSTLDCENVLIGGSVQEPELENGTWRYQVVTPKLCVVVRFVNEETLQIITAWRF